MRLLDIHDQFQVILSQQTCLQKIAIMVRRTIKPDWQYCHQNQILHVTSSGLLLVSRSFHLTKSNYRWLKVSDVTRSIVLLFINGECFQNKEEGRIKGNNEWLRLIRD